MQKKKKIKQTLSNLEKRKPPFKIAYPLGKTKSNKPFMIKMGGVWLDPIKMLKGIDQLHKEVGLGKAGKAQILKKLTEFYISKKLNWFVLIMLAETVGLSPDKLFGVIQKYFKEERTTKLRVAMMNPLMVQQLLKKINKWGGVSKAWKNYKDYIDGWCKLTGTPKMESFGAFKNYVTAWKDLTVGKRFKSKDYQSSKMAEYAAKAEIKLKEKGYKGK